MIRYKICIKKDRILSFLKKQKYEVNTIGNLIKIHFGYKSLSDVRKYVKITRGFTNYQLAYKTKEELNRILNLISSLLTMSKNKDTWIYDNFVNCIVLANGNVEFSEEGLSKYSAEKLVINYINEFIDNKIK